MRAHNLCGREPANHNARAGTSARICPDASGRLGVASPFTWAAHTFVVEQKVLVTYRDECFRRWLHVCALSHERKKRSAGSQNPRKSRSAALELCHEILFEEPNHTRSHPRGLIGHDRQRKPRRRGRKGMNERSRGQSVRRSVTRSFVARETWLCTGILFEEPNPELVITRPRRSDSQKGGERRWFVWHGIFIIRKTATRHKQTRRGWEPARVLPYVTVLEREKQKF